MKKAAFLFFRVEVRNAACAVQYLVVVQTMLVRCPKNLDFTMFQKVSLSNLIFFSAIPYRTNCMDYILCRQIESFSDFRMPGFASAYGIASFCQLPDPRFTEYGTTNASSRSKTFIGRIDYAISI